MDALLGIDIGTSGCKVALFTLDGSMIGSASDTYPVINLGNGYVEQDPNCWWEAVCRATRRVMASTLSRRVSLLGIGVDGQGWSMVALDRKGSVLCNSPIWMDTRAQDICTELKERVDADRLFAVCGNPLEPTYSLPKIVWLKRNCPELFEQVDRVLQCNSYIVYRLTGEKTQDISQGYGLQCFDLRRGTWSDEMCQKLGVPRALLPEVLPCDRVVGTVGSGVAEATGLPKGVPVIAGGVDAACGALGIGVIAPGETQEQGGQAEGMSICTDTCITDPRLISGFHVVPDRWLLQGGTVGGGGVIDWTRDNLFRWNEENTENIKDIYNKMNNLINQVPAGSQGVVFLPYMQGERSPLWNSFAKGVFYGLDFRKTRAHLCRACYEGVAYSLRHNLEVAAQAGAPAGELRAMGGSANSEVYTQIKADVTGKVIKVASSDTATTLGAAILAGVGVSAYADFEEARERTKSLNRVYEPDKTKTEVYRQGFELYLDLYRHLKSLMVQREEVEFQ